MAMQKAQKNELIAEVNGSLKDSSALVVVHYKGLTVAEISDFRKKARETGTTLRVVKNLLAKRAVQGTDFEVANELLKGQTALAYSKDPVAAAKCVVEYAKTNEKLVVVGGAFSQKIMSPKEVEQLAKMPSLDELRARIVGMLKTPATRIASVLQAPGGQVARVIAAKAKKD